MKDTNRIINLLKKYLKDKQKYAQDKEFVSLLQQYPFLENLLKELTTEERLRVALKEYGMLSEGMEGNSEHRMWTVISKEVSFIEETKIRKIPSFWKYISAACIIGIAMIGLWKLQTKEMYTAEELHSRTVQLLPGSNKATLQLSDGELIELSSDHKGVIVGEDISYDDGTSILDNLSKESTMLTLSIPKGGQYNVVLPDGTKVWMNADSKLIYPLVFKGVKREVRLEGEAYFEVAKNLKKPFVVNTAKERVEVLGTHFNVNAYKDETVSRVTLLEGSVKVVLPNELQKIIQPGQQTITQEGQILVLQVNLEETIAWKNGEFMFNRENLESVMRKLARWYDLDIEVMPNLRDIAIWGSISRYDDFSKVLEIIQMTDENIKFKIEGRRVKLMK